MIVVRMIAIQTFMILYPPVTSHSRPPIARLGLLLCFQPDGSVLGVSESNEEAADPFIRFHLTLWYRSSSVTLYTDGSRCARLGLTHSPGRPFLLEVKRRDLYLPRDVYTALAIVQGDRASREAIVALTVLDALLWRQAATTAVLSPST